MDLHDLSPAAVRAALPGLLRSRVRADDATLDALDAVVQGFLDQRGDDDLSAMLSALEELGEGWRPWPAEPNARALSRAWMGALVAGGAVEGLEHAEAAAGPGQVWVCNHLSYADTQATDALLCRAGRPELADELIAVAGPKVYTELFRRLAALGLNTLKTAQSASIEHNPAGLGPRDIAMIARESLNQAARWRAERGPVLLYPEGSRSRSGRLQPFLRAAARYLSGAERVLPVVVLGTDRLMNLDGELRPEPVVLRFGEPFTPGRDRRANLAEARRRVAALLPPERQP